MYELAKEIIANFNGKDLKVQNLVQTSISSYGLLSSRDPICMRMQRCGLIQIWHILCCEQKVMMVSKPKFTF